jgi:hypothetical protein
MMMMMLLILLYALQCTRVFAADSGAEMLDWITKIQEAQAYFMNLQLGYDVKVRDEKEAHGGCNWQAQVWTEPMM